MARPKNRKRFDHPVPQDQVTEENFRDIANDLFFHQIEYNFEYFDQILAYGYGDDDTDYLRSALRATETLMDIGYDGTMKDLIDFLYTEYDVDGPPSGQTHYPLTDIDSAGGFSDALNSYLPHED